MKKIYILAVAAASTLPAFAQNTLTSAQYKEKVIGYSNQIKKSAEQMDAAAYNTKSAKTGFLPSVSATGSYNHQFNAAPLSFGPTAIDLKPNAYDLNVGVVQNIYAGGAVRNQVKIAKSQEEVYALAKSQTIEGVVYQAEASYWTTSAYGEMRDAMKQYVSIVEKLATIITNRFDFGAASKKDQLMVDTRLKEAQLSLSVAEKNYEISLQNLNILMGVDPNAVVAALDSIDIAMAVPEYASFDSVLTNRPDFRIAEKNIAIQEYATKATLAKFYPQLVAGVKETWGTQSININGDTRFNTIAYAQLNVPIFNWFQRSKERSKNMALTRSLESQKAIVVDNARSELTNAVTSLRQSFDQISVAKANLDYAAQSLDINTYSYEQGRIPILDVLSAQLSWIQAYTNTINAYLQNKIAIASYNKALGNLSQQQP